MKKIITGIVLTSMLWAASPADAATTQIKIDDVVLKTDAAPELKNNRTMVPLRVISENLGTQVQWSNSKITLTLNKDTITLNPDSKTVIKNGKTEQLEVKPYLKSDRIYLPIRFFAETFGSQVDYKQGVVSIVTEPLLLENEKVNTLRYEYHMTMGGIIQEIKGNAYNKAIYKIFQEQKGDKVDEPKEYYWHFNLDSPGSYYKLGQYDFMSIDNKSVEQFDIYTLNGPFPEELLEGYSEYLLHNFDENSWYIFSDNAVQAIQRLMNAATTNGFNKIISNTVV